MKVIWLAPYPSNLILNTNISNKHQFHPASWLVNLAEALKEFENVDLNIITLNTKIKKTISIKSNHITYHFIKAGIPILNRGYPYFFPLNILTSYIIEIKRLKKYLIALNPDIIHAHGTENAYGLAALNSNIPYIISIQGIYNEILKDNNSYVSRRQKELELQQVKSCPIFACRTNFDKSFIHQYNPSAKIYHLNEAINKTFFLNKWENSYQNNSLLFVGTLIERKGIEILLNALQLVKKEISSIFLNIVGVGEPKYVKYLKDICVKKDLLLNTKFYGFLSPEKISALHMTSQIFILPTFVDNSPNSLAEAMVSGMPIIASNIGGIPSMVQNNKSAILISSGDPYELSDKIIHLINNPNIRIQLSKNVKKIAVEKYHPSKVSNETLRIYQEIITNFQSHY